MGSLLKKKRLWELEIDAEFIHRLIVKRKLKWFFYFTTDKVINVFFSEWILQIDFTMNIGCVQQSRLHILEMGYEIASCHILTLPHTICVTLSQFPHVWNWNNFIDLGAITSAKWDDTCEDWHEVYHKQVVSKCPPSLLPFLSLSKIYFYFPQPNVNNKVAKNLSSESSLNHDA